MQAHATLRANIDEMMGYGWCMFVVTAAELFTARLPAGGNLHGLKGGVWGLQEALKRLHEDQADDGDTRSGFYVNTSDHTGRQLFVLVRLPL